jgi:hypothetical protein
MTLNNLTKRKPDRGSDGRLNIIACLSPHVKLFTGL